MDILTRLKEIPESTEVHYYPCPGDNDGEFSCFRFILPRDYTDAGNPRTVTIFATVLNASVSENSTSWSGPLFINPGGPGGSGVEFIRDQGKKIHEIVGKTHTLISFDPRGVNNTTPQTTCFSSDIARNNWALRTGNAFDIDLFDITKNGNSDIRTGYARSLSLGAACQKTVLAGRSAADYTGTPNVAYDMDRIAGAVWKAAGRHEEWTNGTRGLRYWGFSYGSLIGMTYARLFPHRVERMVLDGITDMEDYYQLGWKRNLLDTDKVIQGFFQLCSRAGPSLCAFNPRKGATARDIESRLNDLIKNVSANPVPVYTNDPDIIVPDWISSTDIRSAVFIAVYKPLLLFPKLATALQALVDRDASLLARFVRPSYSYKNTAPEAGTAITCIDGPKFINASLPTMVNYVSLLLNQSSLVAGNWALLEFDCTGMDIPSRGIRPPSLSTTPTQTRNPILFIRNEADPVTSLQNARKMRSWFQNAGLVAIDGALGHCSLAVESRCTRSVIQRYVEDGKVDANKEVSCGVDRQPFDLCEFAVADEDLWSPNPLRWQA